MPFFRALYSYNRATVVCATIGLLIRLFRSMLAFLFSEFFVSSPWSSSSGCRRRRLLSGMLHWPASL